MTSHGLPSAVRLDRRRALSVPAVVAVGCPLLAACGSGDDGSGASGAPAAKPGEQLASTADVPEGGGVVLGEAGLVVTQPTAGEFRAFSSTCSHQACQVTGVTDTIDCVCHGSKFSLADGSVVQGPATEPLPEERVRVEGGSIVLR